MKVSVIVPVYKVEQEIERCLLSVINQDYPNIELVLVNDCTPDSSFDIAKKVIFRESWTDKVVYVTHIKNKGLSSARNSGINAATGDYLFFLDSDDALSNRSVISFLAGFSDINGIKYEVIIGNYQQISAKEKILGHQKHFEFLSSLDIYEAYAHGDLSIIACGKLVQHDFLITNDLYFKDGIYHEDELWSFHLFRVAKAIRSNSEIIYDYYERIGSISFEVKEKNVIDLNTVIEEIYQFYLSDDSNRRTYTALKIEKLKRRSLKWLSRFDSIFMKQELRRLSRIKTGLKSGRLKFFFQNLIFKFPDPITIWFLKKRWNKK